MAREITNGIVFVVHKPGKLARQAMKVLGVKVASGKTTVFGVRCADAVAAVGHDLVTRRWISEEPEDDQMKVFLVAGDGTALLTLSFTDEGVVVHKEPNVWPVVTEPSPTPTA